MSTIKEEAPLVKDLLKLDSEELLLLLMEVDEIYYSNKQLSDDENELLYYSKIQIQRVMDHWKSKADKEARLERETDLSTLRSTLDEYG